MYHRISPPGSTEGISADIFRQQMEIVKRSFNVMTLNELMRSHDNGYTPDNAVVVTFDDGYHDFADYAFPVLRELDIPATLFVTTGFVSEELWLWPDQIRYALDQTKVPKIQLPGVSGTFNIAEELEQCWHRIADHCMLVSNTEKLTLIDALFERLDLEKPIKAPEAYRPLTWDQIRAMGGLGLEVGSHSHSHPILTQLDDNELRSELVTSQEVIRKQLKFDSPAFCYPNGQKVDFDRRVKKALLDLGYKWAVTAYPTPSPLADQFEISRYSAEASMNGYLKTVFGVKYLYMLVG
jgi:peptidoglycan/xylan/chitin deacetylase (PgdA/CDA1 family)